MLKNLKPIWTSIVMILTFDFPETVHSMEKKNEVTQINPVLEGNLVYTNPSDNQQFTFKMKDLIKEGKVDLSRPEFKDVKDDLVILTDPKYFFQYPESNWKLIILIAPRSLIKEKITTTAKGFEKVLNQWNDKEASIGIFWRMNEWKPSVVFKSLISKNNDFISKRDLYQLFHSSSRIGYQATWDHPPYAHWNAAKRFTFIPKQS